ncbi:MAG: hypothetical protein AAB759_02625 [Patescibacteria group bacterium]
MKQETRNCQNCKKDFVIDPDDFGFYEQIKVPPPTRCPRCRLIRRLGWQGQRMLYKRPCAFTGDNVITFYHPDSPHAIYRQDIWWSDKWDPKSYGREYDPARPFFEQWKELFEAVPLPALNTEHTTMVNSDYCNAAASLKNCYLVFSADNSKDCAYGRGVNDASDTIDAKNVHFTELCHDVTMVDRSSRVFSSQYCESCYDIYFSRDLTGCSNCIGCINLRNKQNHIFNKPVAKEEFQRYVNDLDLGSRAKRVAFQKKAEVFFLTQPRKAFRSIRAVNSSGDYLYDCKNVRNSYLVYGGENMRYCQFQEVAKTVNAYDYSSFGLNAELVYEAAWCGLSVYNVKFSVWNYHARDIEYCFGCHGSGNLFGCVGVRNGEYCILNKAYSKDEYLSLRNDIIADMKSRGEYGELFPAELSPWAYNESRGPEVALLTKEEARAHGFVWREEDPRQYREPTSEIPDHIKDVPDTFTREVLRCEDCSRNYKIIPSELAFYRRFSIPIPRRCPLCRDNIRTQLLNPASIYARSCAKCGQAIETSYAPDRPEIVY